MNHYRVCESTHTCRGAHTASCHVCSVSLWHQSLTLLCLLSSCYLPPGLSDLSFSFSFLPSSRSCFSYFPSSPTFRLPIYSLHSCFASLYYVLLSCCVLSPFFLPLVFMSVFSHLLFILFSFIFPSSSLTSFLSHALVYILLPLHPPRPLAFLPVPLNSPCFSLYYFISPSPLLSDFYLVVKSMRQRG